MFLTIIFVKLVTAECSISSKVFKNFGEPVGLSELVLAGQEMRLNEQRS